MRPRFPFYSGLKARNPTQDKSASISYSQSGEDLIIDFVLKNNLGIEQPRYLDIGANDPVAYNNTYLFYRRGARGVLVEPDPDMANNIRCQRPEDTLLDIGISDKEGEADYYRFNPSTLNTFSKNEYEQYQIFYPWAETLGVAKIKIIPVSQVLEEYFNGSFDLLSIDVEGLDYEIIAAMNLKKYRPKVICIESVDYEKGNVFSKSKDIADYLYKNSYFLYADTFINSIFVDERCWNKLKQPKLNGFKGR